QRFRELREKTGKDVYLVNYFISSHPGATLRDEEDLASYLKRRHMRPEQVQDFTPLPLTLSACMYYTEEHPVTGEKMRVAKSFQERKMHRALNDYPAASSGVSKDIASGCLVAPRGGEYNPKRFNTRSRHMMSVPKPRGRKVFAKSHAKNRGHKQTQRGHHWDSRRKRRWRMKEGLSHVNVTVPRPSRASGFACIASY
ncbi:MAG: DUF3362 domain-containing protein, partial [Syntrophorhabdales bacterium]